MEIALRQENRRTCTVVFGFSSAPVLNNLRHNRLAVSLFSGAGGMDIGVQRAGFTNILAIEQDPHCVATLRQNSATKVALHADICSVPPEQVLERLSLNRGELCLLHGGPPCQPFSQIGKRQGIQDPRGLLIFQMVRFADVLRPQAALIEQVPSFLGASMGEGKRVVGELHRQFEGLGYELHVELLDARTMNLPQNRTRAFLVAVPKGSSFSFDQVISKRQTTVGEAFRNMPPPSLKGFVPELANHIDITPARDRERIAYVTEGSWLSKSLSAPPDVLCKLTRKDTTKFRRLHRDSPAPTLRCGEPFYHPTENRYITPREAARLQGFPDDHVFCGPIRGRTGSVKNLDQHRQVANAVPPPLAESVARKIDECLCLV